jgi:hypothetical protein
MKPEDDLRPRKRARGLILDFSFEKIERKRGGEQFAGKSRKCDWSRAENFSQANLNFSYEN